MGNRRHQRNIFNRKVTFAFETVDYAGTIDNISAGGVHVIAETPVALTQGSDILITLVYADQEKDTREARIVWADDSGFGAEFVT